MKILMLGWELPPHNSGGLGVACLNLCKTLASSGADIEFILPYEAEHNIDFMQITAPSNLGTNDLAHTGAYSSQWSNNLQLEQAAYIDTVEEVVDKRQFDVIHAHDWLTFRAALKAKEKTGWPLIVHVHSIEVDRAAGGYGNKLGREVEELTMNLADSVIAVSDHTKQMIIQEYGIPAPKIAVVHNSIEPEPDLSAVSTVNAYAYLTYMRSKGYRVVCNVGRHTIQKGLANLLRAAKKVIAVQPNTFFLLVGDGEQSQELVKLSAELGIAANVIFTGFLRGKALRDSFDIADLFVLPSISEPFGLTPLEAAIAHTPAIISKQSGVSEVLKNVLKVDYWDVDEMANKIAAVIQNDGLRDTLSENAYREVQKFSWQESRDLVQSIYDSSIAGAAQ